MKLNGRNEKCSENSIQTQGFSNLEKLQLLFASFSDPWKEKYLTLKDKFKRKADDWRRFKEEYEALRQRKRLKKEDQEENSSCGVFVPLDDSLLASSTQDTLIPREDDIVEARNFTVMNTFTDLSLSQLRQLNMQNYLQSGDKMEDKIEENQMEEEDSENQLEEDVENQVDKIEENQANCACCSKVKFL